MASLDTTDEIRVWIAQIGVEALARVLREVADRHSVQVEVGTSQGRARHPAILIRAASDLRAAMTSKAVPTYKGPIAAYEAWLEGVQVGLLAAHWMEIRAAVAAAPVLHEPMASESFKAGQMLHAVCATRTFSNVLLPAGTKMRHAGSSETFGRRELWERVHVLDYHDAVFLVPSEDLARLGEHA